MAPNADKSRLQQRLVSEKLETLNVEETQPVTLLKCLKGNEVAIDGLIYDLDGFKHPGGDSIYIFGGNDVTVQYHMIHPFHSSKHLEKMRVVGKVSDYEKE